MDSERLPGCAPEEEADAHMFNTVVRNVVSAFSVHCHLNLRVIGQRGTNVIYGSGDGTVTMKMRHPRCTAIIRSSGKITCTGAVSEKDARMASRRCARQLQNMGFPVEMRNYRVVNVLATCSLPWPIWIVNFTEKYQPDATYEPELHPGVMFRLRKPKANFTIFATGSVIVTTANVARVAEAIEYLYPLVQEFRKV